MGMIMPTWSTRFSRLIEKVSHWWQKGLGRLRKMWRSKDWRSRLRFVWQYLAAFEAEDWLIPLLSLAWRSLDFETVNGRAKLGSISLILQSNNREDELSCTGWYPTASCWLRIFRRGCKFTKSCGRSWPANFNRVRKVVSTFLMKVSQDGRKNWKTRRIQPISQEKWARTPGLCPKIESTGLRCLC